MKRAGVCHKTSALKVAATFAFGYAVATDATEWHKGDTCLRFSPPQTAYGLVCVVAPTWRVGSIAQKKPPMSKRHWGLKNGGYLLSHNAQYHRRC